MLSRSVVIKVSNKVSVLLVMFVVVMFVFPVPHVVLRGGMVVSPFPVWDVDRAEAGVGGGGVKASNVSDIGGWLGWVEGEWRLVLGMVARTLALLSLSLLL